MLCQRFFHLPEVQKHSGSWSLSVALGLLTGLLPLSAEAQNPAAQLTRPFPYEVLQRDGFVPHKSHIHAINGPQRGSAQVKVQGEFPARMKEQFQYRLQILPLRNNVEPKWEELPIQRSAKTTISSTIQVPAGGWYRLEVRQMLGNTQQNFASIEPFGVGEVFLIAGQSYAAGFNDELQRVEDPLERIAAYDTIKKIWQVAHDPQPNVGEGGTIWPPLGEALLPLWEVPIGLVNVAVGGTSSRQWLPGTELFEGISSTGTEIGNFRAVLWQQGESDVIEKVDTATYVKNLTLIRTALAKQWQSEPPWLLAKSTLHPQVYNNPEGEAQIRAAIEELWSLPGFRPGPDTDILAGENRGGPDSRKHFSRLGQRRAAQLWFASVWHEFHTVPSLLEAAADAKLP